jgi:uncharacterized membrane protein YdjX (TVP38/TMEM64 family)
LRQGQGIAGSTVAAGTTMALRRIHAKWLLAAATIAIAASLAPRLPVVRWTRELESWAQAHGTAGLLGFGIAYLALVLCFVPSTPIAVAAGLAFGLLRGVILVSTVNAVAAAIGFLVGRHLARHRIEALAAKHVRLRAFQRALARGDWKLVVLVHVAPVVPFNVGNALFGLSPIGFGRYVMLTWAAMLPGAFVHVLLGRLAHVGASDEKHTTFEIALLVFGLVAGAVLIVYAARLGRRELASLEHERTNGACGVRPPLAYPDLPA